MFTIKEIYAIIKVTQICGRGDIMGKTDSQFKAFIRVTLETLKEIYAETPNEKLKKLIDNLQKHWRIDLAVQSSGFAPVFYSCLLPPKTLASNKGSTVFSTIPVKIPVPTEAKTSRGA